MIWGFVVREERRIRDRFGGGFERKVMDEGVGNGL